MNTILLIIKREYITRVKKRSFLLTTFLIPLLFIAMYALIFYVALNNQEPITKVQVIDYTGYVAEGLSDTDHLLFVKNTDNAENIKQQLEQGEENTVLLIIPEDVASSQTVELYDTEKKGMNTINAIEDKLNEVLRSKALKDAGIDMQILDNIKPDVTVKSKQLTIDGEKDSSIGASIGISFTLSILIYLSLFLYGNQVMRGIIEEKSNRIIEVIISSVKPFQLMMGKIIGIGLVGVTQFVLWIILSASLMTGASALMLDKTQKEMVYNQTLSADQAMQQSPIAGGTPNSKMQNIIESIQTVDFGYVIGTFLIYFIGGYLLYSALFAMVGSAVDSETETQQFMLPIIMPLLFTYMLSFSVLVNNPHGSLAFWLSMIPFTSPIGMLVRVPFGVPVWQLALSIGLLIIGFLTTTYVAARIYRVGILMYGKKASYKELIKWFRYKG